MPETKDRAHDETISSPRTTFEGIREVVARLEPPARTGQHADAGGAGAFDRIQLACQPGGELHTGAECRRCARFVNWVPSPDRAQVTIRCLWRESDRAADLMAHAGVVPVASEDMSVGEAALHAAASGLQFVVVAENGAFRGLLRTDASDTSSLTPVRERMIRPTWSVPADASLRDVVDVMQAHQTDIVPVLAAGALVGVITRDALCNAGLACAFDPP
jgi:CBS domain-containing protein